MVTHFLLQGMESQRKVQLLLSLSKSYSGDVGEAMVRHLADGYAASMCSFIFDVSQQSFSRSLGKLNQLNDIVQNIILAGGASTDEGFKGIMSLWQGRSDNLEAALRMHFVEGCKPSEAYRKFNVREQNFTRAKKRVNNIIETIKGIQDEH